MKIYTNKKLAFLFLLPAILFLLVFVYYPIIESFVLSLFKWKTFEEGKTFVGLEYYKRLLSDPVFWTALKNNALYAAISIVIQVGLGLVIAAVLEERIFRRYQNFFRAVYFMPAVISLTVIGLMFQLVYHPSIGLINQGLRAVGLNSWCHAWLGEKNTAMLSIIAVSQWQSIGYIMLLFLVAIQKIPREIYESAEIAGAGAVQKFFRITLPMVKETLVMSTVITLIGGFKVFDEVYVMTGGGPGKSTEVLASYLYRSGFRNDEMGLASATATVIFLITFTMTFIQLMLSKRADEK